jgi:hypothetical protein
MSKFCFTPLHTSNQTKEESQAMTMLAEDKPAPAQEVFAFPQLANAQ